MPIRMIPIPLRALVAAAAVTAIPALSRGQSSSERVPDRLNVREAYEAHNRAAASARTAGDWATVRRHAAAVDTLFNGNPSTLMAIARASARLGDVSTALDIVGTVMSMGVVRNLEGDQDLAQLASSPEWPALLAANEANARPAGSLRTVFALPSIDFLAEDIVWDGARERYLVSSVRKGRIVAVKRNGTSTPFVSRDDGPFWGVFALAVDSARSRLWMTTVAMPHVEGFVPADSGRAAVIRLDLASGKVIKRYEMRPTVRGNSPGDISLSPGGDLFVSDSRSGALHVVRVDKDSLEVLVPEGTFMSPQGSVIAPDGKSLFVADYIRGLARVSLIDGAVSWLRHDSRIALNGIDGLTFAGPATLVAVQNGVMPNRVMRLTLDADAQAVIGVHVMAQDTATIREPTHGLVIGDDFHFIANSGWDGFGDDGAPVKDQRLTPPAVLSVRLR